MKSEFLGGRPVQDTSMESATEKSWQKAIVYWLLPPLVLMAAVTAAYYKYQRDGALDSDRAAVESLQAAKNSTIALLSYEAGSVDRELTAARDRTTGAFRDLYSKLIADVVIPGAKQQQITTTVTIPAATTVSADSRHALALLFVNQTATVGSDRPTVSLSSVRVSMEKVGNRWLVSGFDPV